MKEEPSGLEIKGGPDIRGILQTGLLFLTTLERQVIYFRFCEELSREDTATILRVTPEEVDRAERNAIEVIRAIISG